MTSSLLSSLRPYSWCTLRLGELCQTFEPSSADPPPPPAAAAVADWGMVAAAVVAVVDWGMAVAVPPCSSSREAVAPCSSVRQLVTRGWIEISAFIKTT